MTCINAGRSARLQDNLPPWGRSSLETAMRCAYACASVIWFSFASVALPQQGFAQPSFNCALAQTDSERAICASPELAGLDQMMAHLYQKAWAARTRAARHALAGQQKQWLGYRNACGSDRACLTEVHHQRIQQSQPTSLPAPSPPVLARAIDSLTELPRPETAPPAEPAPALGLDPLEELKELR